MLAAFLLHRMIMNTKRRKAVEIHCVTPEKVVKKVSTNDFCRTCLGKNNLRPIFSNSGDGSMSQTLKQSTNLEIKKNDALSQKICNECLRTIITILNFRSKCREAEKILLEMVKKNKTKIGTDNLQKSKKESLDYIKTVVEELDYTIADNTQDDIELETSQDVRPNIHQLVRQDAHHSVGDKVPVAADGNTAELSSARSKNVPNGYDKVPSIWDRNIPARDDILQPFKAPPRSPQEELQNTGKLPHFIGTVLVPMKCGIVDYKNKFKKEQQKKVIPPRTKRGRRPYMRLPPGPPYKCDTCHKEYQNKPAYATHVRSHTIFVVCEDCGKTFRNTFAMQIHQRAMHGLAKYKCSHCDFRGASRDSIIVHERRHTGERPFVCDHCAAGFYTRQTLIQHLGIHMPYTVQCPYCPKKLRSQRMLSNHKAVKHAKHYSYLCPKCPKTFRNRQNMRKHTSRIHHIPHKEQPKIQKTLLYDDRHPS